MKKKVRVLVGCCYFLIHEKTNQLLAALNRSPVYIRLHPEDGVTASDAVGCSLDISGILSRQFYF